MRFIVGVELAIPVIDRLSLLQEEASEAIKAAHGAVRWTPVPQMRLNLKIFRDLEDSAASRVQGMISDFAAALRPFSFDTRGTSTAREPGSAKLVTTHVHDGTKTLHALRQHIDQAAEHIGFSADRYAWKPQVLIGRLATPHGAVDFEPIFAPFERTVWGETRCRELILYRSERIGRTARERVVRRFELGTGR